MQNFRFSFSDSVIIHIHFHACRFLSRVLATHQTSPESIAAQSHLLLPKTSFPDLVVPRALVVTATVNEYPAASSIYCGLQDVIQRVAVTLSFGP